MTYARRRGLFVRHALRAAEAQPRMPSQRVVQSRSGYRSKKCPKDQLVQAKMPRPGSPLRRTGACFEKGHIFTVGVGEALPTDEWLRDREIVRTFASLVPDDNGPRWDVPQRIGLVFQARAARGCAPALIPWSCWNAIRFDQECRVCVRRQMLEQQYDVGTLEKKRNVGHELTPCLTAPVGDDWLKQTMSPASPVTHGYGAPLPSAESLLNPSSGDSS
jgi:hypothetical protein